MKFILAANISVALKQTQMHTNTHVHLALYFLSCDRCLLACKNKAVYARTNAHHTLSVCLAAAAQP